MKNAARGRQPTAQEGVTGETQPSCDPLSALAVVERLDTVCFGRTLRFHPEVGSTNDVAWAWVREGADEGALILADAQTAGRGRRGRRWASPAGKGVYLSLVLRPEAAPRQLGVLSLAMATAVADAIAGLTSLPVQTKWPNDLVVNQRKLGGILVEAETRGDQVETVVLGIGINVSLKPADVPAELHDRITSLVWETGDRVSRVDVICAVLREAEVRYARFLEGETARLLAEYRKRERCVGRAVTVRTGARVLAGVAEGIGPRGELLVRTETGRLCTFAVGEVTLRESRT